MKHLKPQPAASVRAAVRAATSVRTTARAATSVRTAALVACALACLSACDRKELVEHQDLYAATVSLRPDWQSQSPTAPGLQIRIRGTHPATGFSPAISTDTTFTLASGASDAPVLLTLPEAAYSLTAWHEAPGVSFDGTRFHLSTLPDGTLAEPAPLCAAAITFSTIAGQENRPPLKLQPQTRPLKLYLNISQGTAELITDINATLTGCAATRELTRGEKGNKLTRGGEAQVTRTAEIGNEGSVRPAFTRDGNTLSATYRLLGIVPAARQMLTLTLHYAEGNPQTEVYDLTSFLSGFNNFSPGGDTGETFTLTADLQLEQNLETPGISGTITGWTPGTETDMEAGNH